MCELSWGGEDEEGDKYLALDKSTYINLLFSLKTLKDFGSPLPEG